jgi:uncharacterized repeat protein (TIGR03803 family)
MLKGGMRLRQPRFLNIVLALPALVMATLTLHNQAVGNSETVLWNFDGSDGTCPGGGGLITDKSGNLFGTTDEGGPYGSGTVFELIRPTNDEGSWTESVLWNFNPNAPTYDGCTPTGGLIMDKSGNLYGMTACGGAYGYGAAFELTPPSSSGGSWNESILWSFGSGADGYYPGAGLIMDKSGNLYGTTRFGGTYRWGTVFELIPPRINTDDWTESILWNFSSVADGDNLEAGLLMDKSGDLFGTTAYGGKYSDPDGLSGGTVFKLTPPSTSEGSWRKSILWNFGKSDDGNSPWGAGLIRDERGNLYGTTSGGGRYGGGTAFKLSRPETKEQRWKESILWNFGNGGDGDEPRDALLMGKGGDLYGTTQCTDHGNSCSGTVFKLVRPEAEMARWRESILFDFGSVKNQGGPSGLIMDKRGNLYGTTCQGGLDPLDGIVFKISRSHRATDRDR